MAFTTTPNMSLQVPVVGGEPGPLYATDVNNSLTTIDGHTHAVGSGVLITPAAINLISDLPFLDNNATQLRSVRFTSQLTPLSLPSDIGCIYVSGVDLYYNDVSGNQIRITQTGSVAGPFGTITGLPSGTASASYATGVFTFQSATNTAANIDAGSYVFRNSSPSSFGLTLQPPTIGADYSVTLPPPNSLGQTGVLTYDVSNNIGIITYDGVGQGMTSVGANAIGVSMTATGANAIAASMTATGADSIATTMDATGATTILNKATRAESSPTGGVGNIVNSGAIPAFSTSSTSFVTVPGSGLVITNSGRPIMLMLTASPNAGGSFVGGTDGYVEIMNNTTGTSFIWQVFPNGTQFATSFVTIDAGAGVGTYSYSVLMAAIVGSITLTNAILWAHEIH
jgi:hypothetical protein